MLGTLVGDFSSGPWSTERRGITATTVGVIAVADALLKGGTAEELERSLRAWCVKYHGLSYSQDLRTWANAPAAGPYHGKDSVGVLRVAPCGWMAQSLEEAEALAERATCVTHDGAESICASKAFAAAIWLFKSGATPSELEAKLQARYGYELGLSLYARTAQNIESERHPEITLPSALDCAIHATSVKHAIARAAIMEGRTSTIASLAAAIAEARFGLSQDELTYAMLTVPEDMLAVVHEFYAAVDLSPGKRPPLAAEEPAKAPAPMEVKRGGPLAGLTRWLGLGRA